MRQAPMVAASCEEQYSFRWEPVWIRLKGIDMQVTALCGSELAGRLEKGGSTSELIFGP